jgi:hypothetical protein
MWVYLVWLDRSEQGEYPSLMEVFALERTAKEYIAREAEADEDYAAELYIERRQVR